ncbi:hypothetical protein IQ03_03147 [Gemmobacter caeni]|uniref:DUF1127 domain-containing protein n=1 Tax=Gemmobacter caeni TaxID=589035 RepID=A0A2T6AWT3_9RHOB|nr:hypothetical protein [Gemmobacter caeni]PTX48272.1 hypothetical protein C8N34_110132 [Gemmobacter caeni]TWI96862.1 hypothetical protein IQ03_03147 [Gemmobacter caeni]
MSYTSDIPGRNASLGRKFGAQVLASIGAALTRYGRIRSRADRVEQLQALSDAELAKLGLTRDRIVQHVFRDQFYY